jgi:hypothetical protein
VPSWVLGADNTFFAFFAGYLDAEGYIRTYLPPGYKTLQSQLEVRSYDALILSTLGDELNKRAIRCAPARVRVMAGYQNGQGVVSNGDLWGLGISRKVSLIRLFEQIAPYLRHGRRRRDMMRAWETLSG